MVCKISTLVEDHEELDINEIAINSIADVPICGLNSYCWFVFIEISLVKSCISRWVQMTCVFVEDSL